MAKPDFEEEKRRLTRRRRKDNVRYLLLVSQHCAGSLHEAVKEAWGSENSTNGWNTRWELALSRAYESADKACEEEYLTALVVLISPCQIVAANCGDGPFFVVDLRLFL